MSKRKTVPFPRSLSRSIIPPIASTRRATIDSPRPVPPNRRDRVPSACSNGSKIRPCFVTSMPMPVSRTSKRTRRSLPSGVSHHTLTTISPEAVNLMALPRRFTRIWRSRIGSPQRRSGTAALTPNEMARPFSAALTASAFTVSVTSSRIEK